jgi:hypothetical protein
MGRQCDDARARLVRISKEVAVRVDGVSGGVQAICRLDGIEYPIPILFEYVLNFRAWNNVEGGSGCHHQEQLFFLLLSRNRIGSHCIATFGPNDILHPSAIVNSVEVLVAKVRR